MMTADISTRRPSPRVLSLFRGQEDAGASLQHDLGSTFVCSSVSVEEVFDESLFRKKHAS